MNSLRRFVILPFINDSTARVGGNYGRAFSGLHQLPVFRLEQSEAWHAIPESRQLSCSECEPLSLHDALEMADEECKDLWQNLSLGYSSHNQGSPLLRQEISKSIFSGDVDPDRNILICAPSEGILISMMSLLKPGDRVIACDPAYQSLHSIASTISGCKVVPWKTKLCSDSGYFFDVDDLKRLLAEGDTKLVVVNFPHNPTGADLDLRQVERACEQSGVHLFHDAMYALSHRSPESDRTIHLGGISKTFGMPGARLGWICSRDEAFIKRARQIKDYVSLTPPVASEVLGLIALRNKDVLHERCRRLVANGEMALLDFLERSGDALGSCVWTRPSASTCTIGVLNLGESFLEAFYKGSSAVYAQELCENHSIMIVSTDLLDFNKNGVRIGLGKSSINEALAAWERVLLK